MYMLQLSSMYGIKCLGEIYRQWCCLEIFCTYSLDDLTDSQNQWSCLSIFLKEFSRFQIRYHWEEPASTSIKVKHQLFLVIPGSPFLERRMKLFVYFSIVFCLLTVSDTYRSKSSIFFCLPYLRVYFVEDSCFSGLRGLFWTSVRSVALEKEQWQTWGL